MKLYDSAVAPNPRRVRIFLAEKGIQVPTVQVDIGKAENRTPPYLARNPLGGLPFLELDDGTVIAESVAICRYFEAVHPEPALLGTGAVDQARVEMWQRRMELEVFRYVTGCFQNTHAFFKGRIEQVPEYGEVCRRAGRKRLAWLDEELAGRPFVAGDRYTIADITALCAIDFGRVVDIRIAPEQKHLARWHEAVSSRPSAKALCKRRRWRRAQRAAGERSPRLASRPCILRRAPASVMQTAPHASSSALPGSGAKVKRSSPTNARVPLNDDETTRGDTRVSVPPPFALSALVPISVPPK